MFTRTTITAALALALGGGTLWAEHGAGCGMCGGTMEAKHEAPGAAATAPAHHDHATTQPTTQSAKGYVCPMHPEVMSDHAGKCPKCGMDLELKAKEKPEHKEDSTQRHQHEH